MTAVAAVSMWRNEADIGPTMIRHLLAEGVGLIVVADNLSTDGTAAHLQDFVVNAQGAVLCVPDPEVAYNQADKMTRLAKMAGEAGAEWIVPFDADELWYSPHGRLVDVLAKAREDIQWVEGMYHIPHADDDPTDPNPVTRMRYRRQGRDCPQAKVAFRYRRGVRLHMGNHNVEYPRPARYGFGRVAFREFQYRSFEQFVAKVRHGKKAYDMTDLPETCGIHWRRLGGLDDEALRAEWERYLATPTVLDPAPLRAGVTAISA